MSCPRTTFEGFIAKHLFKAIIFTFCCSIESALHMTHDTSNSQACLVMVHDPETVDLRMNTVSLLQDAACDGGTPTQNEVLSGASSQCSHHHWIGDEYTLEEEYNYSTWRRNSRQEAEVGTKRSIQSMLQIDMKSNPTLREPWGYCCCWCSWPTSKPCSCKEGQTV